MSQKELSITFDFDGTPVALTVVRATARMGAERGYQIGLAIDEIDKDENFPEPLKYLRTSVFPTLVSLTSKIEGIDWPMTFEQLQELPEELIDKWLAAIYKCNPHLDPMQAIAESQGESDPKNSQKRKRH